jgi:hypothetical protein
MPENIHSRPCSGPEPVQETPNEMLVKIEDRIDPDTRDFYQRAILTVERAGIPLLVGGAFAFEFYTGISRNTKDFDIFVRGKDAGRVLDLYGSRGYKTEITANHWLAKVCAGDSFVDIIFGAANGVSEVDDRWFEHSIEQKILGMDLKLCPVEEMIWSKAFVMDRERYDGADVAHLIQAQSQKMDWDRLLFRFNRYWHVLLSHLLLFTFIYPSEFDRIPGGIMQELLRRLQDELKNPPHGERICQGTLLSMFQYTADISRWGYKDARELKGAL